MKEKSEVIGKKKSTSADEKTNKFVAKVEAQLNEAAEDTKTCRNTKGRLESKVDNLERKLNDTAEE